MSGSGPGTGAKVNPQVEFMPWRTSPVSLVAAAPFHSVHREAHSGIMGGKPGRVDGKPGIREATLALSTHMPYSALFSLLPQEFRQCLDRESP